MGGASPSPESASIVARGLALRTPHPRRWWPARGASLGYLEPDPWGPHGASGAGPTRAAELTCSVAGRLSERRRRSLARAIEDLGLDRVARLPPASLAAECGLTRSQARRLAAMFELGREVERAGADGGVHVRRPADAIRLLAPELRGQEVECFRVLVLDVRRRVIGNEEVSRGTLDAALVHPREVFRPALRLGGASLLLAHNHPSGDPEPSPQDWSVSLRLVRAGRLLGVPVTDHLILAGCRWVSMGSRDRWPRGAEVGAARAPQNGP
jgi:DNA repair protein RadC